MMNEGGGEKKTKRAEHGKDHAKLSATWHVQRRKS